MGKARSPRRGSMQFWPRKRSKHSFVRVRSWAQQNKAKLLGFIAYKAGMTQVMILDNRPNSMTKGEKICVPVTVFDCPPIHALGVSFYKNSGRGAQKVAFMFSPEISKDAKKIASKKISLSKKEVANLDEVKDFDYLRLLVMSNPSLTTTGNKKPKFSEMAIGGSKDDQLNYAKETIGKELKIEDVFNDGNLVDIHAVTKGKGFQGTVKRYGVAIMQHKAEKCKRGIANMGAWTPKRVDYRISQPGKMGFHLRTEYNKQIVKIGDNKDDVNPKSGWQNFGLVKNSYLLLRGSVTGPRKGAVLLSEAIRPKAKLQKEIGEIVTISK
ncbi:MAG: 50S ribosomal protein L3 [archaeon]|nr:50S ribosomal protein L3 [Nanoarchaeota archaeon]